jgi:hypothetical protein
MKNRKIPPTGEVRQSQMLTTFGPGSMVDLPNHSVVIGGLDYWVGDKQPIHEERLENWLTEKLKWGQLKLYAPPTDNGDLATSSGVAVFQFPAWFLGQVDQTWEAPDKRIYRTRPLIPWARLVKGGYLNGDRKVVPVVPVRFVQACVRGHLSDIDWYAFVRPGGGSDQTGDLWMDEGGAGSDLAEVFVRDEKNQNFRRPLTDATLHNKGTLGKCRGRQPWLGPRVYELCDKSNRLLVRSASNAYFSQTVSVIAIPSNDAAVKEAINKVWEDHLQHTESQDDVRKERKREKVKAALDGFSDEVVWAEVQRKLSGAAPVTKGIKQVEIETFLAQKESLGEDKPEGDFFARSHPVGAIPKAAEGKIDRLVLIHRLMEVTAQIGFTRFEASSTNIDGELDLDITLAPLSREPSWLPAVQNRGEGIFISFSPTAIHQWLQRPAVKARASQLLDGFEAWKKHRGVDAAMFAGLPYIMLQSLAHMMLTVLSLDCGYSASSIRERVYAGESGYGILLYTGSPSSEGTLGGLVDMGKNIGRHLERALEFGRLCSNDPVCAQHEPTNTHEERFLHGAACHGCLLIAETSCERRNEFLDRALVVPTVVTSDTAFFLE